jgi:hypothetical protein
MALNGGIMERISPKIFENGSQAGSVEKLVENDNYMKEKCTDMNDIEPTQFFLPTTLRS